MAMNYGVLRGTFNRFVREEDLSDPHLQIKVIDGNGKAWRVPVNILSQDKSLLVFHRVDPLQNHPILDGLSSLAPGFTHREAGARGATNALDFLRAPLFPWPTGVAIPSTGQGADDDLQDAIVTYLKQLEAQGGELFAFGEMWPKPGQGSNDKPIDKKFETHQGVHQIHMNQGNPPGNHDSDNGVFQDGGLILKLSNRFVGLFMRFQTQLLPTDNTTGFPLPNAHRVPPGGDLSTQPVPGGPGTVPGPTTPTSPPPPSPTVLPAVYVERALINPAGDDTRKEVVVLGNTTTSTVDLNGWSIVDRNNHADTLAGIMLPGGESRAVKLTGAGAQLGNRGGTIVLRDKSGAQVHAVSYSEADANVENRYIRFTT